MGGKKQQSESKHFITEGTPMGGNSGRKSKHFITEGTPTGGNSGRKEECLLKIMKEY